MEETQEVMEVDLQDGVGVRRGHHLPPHRYIKNTSTCVFHLHEQLLQNTY